MVGSVLEEVEKALEGLEAEIVESKGAISVSVSLEAFVEAAERLKKLGFDHVKSVTVIDNSDQGFFEIVYHLSSYSNLELAKQIVALKTRTSSSEARVPSLYKLWESCLFLEREEYDLVGVVFEGHPRLERLLLPEDWEGPPPLRKEYKIKTEGIDV